MIEITFNAEELSLRVEGHAGQADKGQDIVCSAVSTLFWTLAKSLLCLEDTLTEGVKIEAESGAGEICCRPKDEYLANVSVIFWTILNGFEGVADTYPEYVKLNIIEKGEKK